MRVGDHVGAGESRGPDLRILLLTDKVPDVRSGYGMRVANVLQGLKAAGRLHVCLIDSSTKGERLPEDEGYAVTVVRAANPPRWAKLLGAIGMLPSNVVYRETRALQTTVRAALGGEAWDLVWCSRARVHLLTRELRGGARIVDLDDLNDRLLHTEIRDRRARHGWLATMPRNLWDRYDAVRWQLLQGAIARDVDRVVVCSEVDRAHLGQPNCAVVPNGYPTPLAPGADDEDELGNVVGLGPTLLFVGPLTYEPNRLAVEWLICDVMPLLRERIGKVSVVVVGDIEGVAFATSRHDGVSFVGEVPDVAPYYQATDVAVAPLHSGGGTRLKVIEALARSVPLVSTPLGCEGLDLAAGKELLVADGATDFAAACASIIEDRGVRDALVAAGAARYERDLTAARSVGVVRALASLTAEAAQQDVTP